MREIAVLKKLDHPNIVRLLEVINPPKSSYIMMVMEYMERGVVLETKGQSGFARLPEGVALEYFRQVCSGLDYLHFHGIKHGDLKPENLLLASDNQVKIGDFGSCSVITDTTISRNISRTPAFQAPECIDKSTISSVCLFCLVFGRLPFAGSCVLNMNHEILKGVVDYSLNTSVSPLLIDLLKSIFVADPHARISLQGIMSHPWVCSSGEAPLISVFSLPDQVPAHISVSAEEEQNAIAQPSLASLIRAKLKEKQYEDGRIIFTEGDEAHCIYMIMSGVVELITHTRTSDAGEAGRALEELCSIKDRGSIGSLTVDLDDSFNLENETAEETGVVPSESDGKLHISRERADELRKRRKKLMFGDYTEYVVEVKGPGQMCGEVSLDRSFGTQEDSRPVEVSLHKHSARCKGPVTVVTLTEANFLTALLQVHGGNRNSSEAKPCLSHESASMLLMQELKSTRRQSTTLSRPTSPGLIHHTLSSPPKTMSPRHLQAAPTSSTLYL
eukprot:gene15340-21427_t